MKTYGVDHLGPIKIDGNEGSSNQVLVSQVAGNKPQWKNLKNTIEKNSAYTEVPNDEIFCDTSSGSFNITLPASPSIGDSLVIIDEASSFDINNLTVLRNGSTILGVTDDIALDMKNVRVIFTYDGDTWQVSVMSSDGI